MGNPRQRRKLRSGSHRVVRHSNNAKKNLKKQPPIRGPKVLQEAWDEHKTVRQNYEDLGLVASLKPTASGGVEKVLGVASSSEPCEDVNSTPGASGSAAADALPRGFGRIVRDAAGNVVDVLLPEEGDEETIEPDDDATRAARGKLAEWVDVGRRGGASGGGSGAQTQTEDSAVVQDLEELVAARTGPAARHASVGELGGLRLLVAKHGHDVEAMARDRRLNVEQRTAGQLSRAIKKAGGFAALADGS